MSFMRVHEVAKQLNVSPSTVRRYVSQEGLECSYTPTGQRVFTQEQVDKWLGKQTPKEFVFYARSSSGDKKLIQSQLDKLTAAYGEPLRSYKDAGSGLNENRNGLWRMVKDAEARDFSVVYVTSKDRLSRFGLRYLEHIFNTAGVEIIALDDEREKSAHDELLQDFMNLLASFSGKFYKMRSIEHKRMLLERVKQELDEK